MSRIFDALSRTDGGYEEILQPLREHTGEAAVALKPPLSSETGPSPASFPVKVAASEEAPARMEDVIASLAETKSLTVDAPALPGIRTAPLRIPLSVPALPFDGVNDSAIEEYRMIRSRILHHPLQPRVFLVSSPCPGDGKTITTLNMAGALALKGTADVLVIDADFARSAFGAITGIASSPGLGEVLSDGVALEDAVVRAEQLPHLHLLSAGRSRTNPAELLDSEAWARFLESIRRRFGYVVFDSPPVEAVPYYGRLLAACDGMILVARPDHTGRQELTDALEGIPENKLLGVVLNCHSRWFLNKKDYKSYNRYYTKPQS